MRNNHVAKHAHLAGRAGVHEKSGKHYRRTSQKLIDVDLILEDSADYLEEFIPPDEQDKETND